jgi:phosphonate transport system substrate-binding protein
MFKIIFLVSILIRFSNAEATQKESLNFGIVPQQLAKRLAWLWTPLVQHISQQIGINMVFRTAKDIPTLEQRLAKGEYDIAYMTTYHYVVLNKNVGYNAIAKQQGKKIRAVIIAKVGGDIKGIDDLQGPRLVFPAPATFAASILTRNELKKNVNSFTSMNVSSHDSIYLNNHIKLSESLSSPKKWPQRDNLQQASHIK